jgi:hypothetical protein
MSSIENPLLATALTMTGRGEASVTTWVTNDGTITDWWLDEPDAIIKDDGHAERLTALRGEHVVFAGQISAQQALELLSEGEK